MEFAGTIRTRRRYALSGTLDKHLKAESPLWQQITARGSKRKPGQIRDEPSKLIGTDFELN
jgi:hypothetical protein